MSDINSQGNNDKTKNNALNIKQRSRSISHDKNLKNHHSRSVYKNYTVEYKLKIIALTEREYGISRNSIRNWVKNKSLLNASTNKKNTYKAFKTGGISNTLEFDGIIAAYIKELRSNNLPVNTTDVILYAKEIVPIFKDRSLISLRS